MAVSKKNNVSLTVLASVSANGNVARMNKIIYCCNINSRITSAIRGHLSDTVGCINFSGKKCYEVGRFNVIRWGGWGSNLQKKTLYVTLEWPLTAQL